MRPACIHSHSSRGPSLAWPWMPICVATFFSRAIAARRLASQTLCVMGFCTKACLPCIMAHIAPEKCMWSHVLTVTASISLSISSSILRRSLYRLAFGHFLNAPAAARSSTSQSATIFAPHPAASLRSPPPLPPQPMPARLVLSFAPKTRCGRTVTVRAVAATPVRNSRLETTLFFMCPSSLRCGHNRRRPCQSAIVSVLRAACRRGSGPDPRYRRSSCTSPRHCTRPAARRWCRRRK